MNRTLIGMVGIGMLVASGADAGSNDGTWKGSAYAGGPRCAVWTITMTVTNTQFTGSGSVGSSAPPSVAGTIDTDGTVHGHAGPFTLTGQFSGDAFTGTFTGNASPQGPCMYAVKLSRS
jgi:hypothetical protein